MTRYKSCVAVFLVLMRENNNVKEILLQKRMNTGYMDGFYDCSASGHLDEGESVVTALIREAHEEIDITVNKEDVRLVSMFHNHKEGYVRFFFRVESYTGEPKIMEKDKCSELTWFPIDNLPRDTVPHLRIEINNIVNNIFYDDCDNYLDM